MVAALAARIASGGIAAGAKLPSESELVTEFGVSRTVVREAISQLRARGLVATHRGIGTFTRTPPAGVVDFPVKRVHQATLADVLALRELRISLETEAAALAAKRLTPEQLAKMESLLEQITRTALSGGDAAVADFEFHMWF